MQSKHPSPLGKYLGPALAGLFILAILWGGLRYLISRPNRPFETDLGLLLGAAAFCLLLGLAGLTLFLRPASFRGPARVSARGLPFALALSYLVPLLAFRLPEWALLMRERPASVGIWRVLGPLGLAAGQPWFFLWQVFCLAFYAASWLKISSSNAADAHGLPVGKRRWSLSILPTVSAQAATVAGAGALPAEGAGALPAEGAGALPAEGAGALPAITGEEAHSRPQAPKRFWPKGPATFWPNWVVGLLGGLGLWLAAALAFSLLDAPLESLNLTANPPANVFPAALMPVLLLAAFVVSPLAGEWIFRRLRPQRLAAYLPASAVRWVCAALFALLQSHPLMWLPGFLLGLGLGELVRRTGRLLPAVVAHVLYNALMLLLNPALIM